MKIIRSLLISLCMITMIYVTWYYMPTKTNSDIIIKTSQSSFVIDYSYSKLLDSHESKNPEAIDDAIIKKNKNINFPLYFIFLGIIIGIYLSIYFLLDIFYRLVLIYLKRDKTNSLFGRIFKKRKVETVIYEKNTSNLRS